MAQKDIEIRFVEHEVRGKDIENFCCDEMYLKNYWCKTIHDDHMRFQKQEPICSNCPLYLFKLHIMGVTGE